MLKRFSRVSRLCDFLSVIKLSTIQMSKILCAYKTGTGLISEQTGRGISLLYNVFIFFLNAALLIYIRCGYTGLFYRSTLGNWCGACDRTFSR